MRPSNDEVDEIFAMFDLEGLGRLTNEELLLALKALGVTSASKLSLGDASDLMRRAKEPPADTATVNKAEFLQVLKLVELDPSSNAETEGVFRLWDRSRKGTLAVDDLTNVYAKAHGLPLESVSAARKRAIADMFVLADRRGRGINFEDWKAVVNAAVLPRRVKRASS